MKELFGNTIYRIYISESNDYIVFVDILGENWAYEAHGDCCSTSFIQSILNPGNLLHERIIGIEEKYFSKEYIDEAEKQKGDVSLELFGYTLKTLKGYCDIEFRNESNGFYGGDCRYREDLKLYCNDKLISETSLSYWMPKLELILKSENDGPIKVTPLPENGI